MPKEPLTTLVEVTRGMLVESLHVGALTIVDSSARLVTHLGDPGLVTFLRSSSKPLQAIPLIEHGGVDAYQLTPREIAVMCGSHSGTDEHVRVISGLQARVGITEADLLCGIHEPTDRATALALRERGEKPTPNRHNCSGKHTGFLTYSALRELPFADYIDPHFPLQQSIIRTFAEMTSVPLEEVHLGIDGCSVPVFAIPLANAALGIARLCDPIDLGTKRAEACRLITRSMTEHPDMVAGPGQFDTVVMEQGHGKFICKGGAEGYMVLGIMPGALRPESPGLGIAFKIADGDQRNRARPIVAIQVLRAFGLLSDEQIEENLANFGPRAVTNWAGLEVGEIRPAFQLELA